MIFIVEDDENIREMESYALKNSGFEVFGFADGKSFFDALEKRNPLLIVLDIMLPGEDGMEILKKIKTTAKTKNIPVIMVTAKTSEIDVVKGLDISQPALHRKTWNDIRLVYDRIRFADDWLIA